MKLEAIRFFKTLDDSLTFTLSSAHLAWNEKVNVILCTIHDETKKIILQGHHSDVSALEFDSTGDWLISGSCDYLILWDVSEVISAHASGTLVRGHILCRSDTLPICITISPNHQIVCAVSEKVLLLYDFVSKEVLHKIHAKNTSGGQFSDDEHVITVSLSGCTTMWNIQNGQCVWRKQSQHGHCLTSITCRKSSVFAVGSSVSQVNEFRFHEKAAEFKESCKVDLDERLMHINPEWKQTDAGAAGQVLSMMYIKQNDYPESDLFPPRYHLLCATDRNVFILDVESQDVNVCRYREEKEEMSLVKRAVFTDDPKHGKIYCAIVRMFSETIEMLSVDISHRRPATNISVISTTPITPTSPLCSHAKLSSKSRPAGDQPVTFKKKVKSSGYSSAPRMTMFQPITSLSKKAAPSKHRSVKATLEQLTCDEAPDWSNAVAVQPSGTFCERACIVNSIDVSARNEYAAFCLSDATAQICRLPIPASTTKFKVVTGHSKPVLGCSWANGKDYLLTYSCDRQVKLWSSPYTGEPSLSVEVISNGAKASKVPSGLLAAKFYYLDKFILAAVGNSLLMYKYALHEGPKDDVKRYLSQSKYKVVWSWPMTTAQSITCFAAPNNMFSYTVLLCGSDRSVEVYDMNACQCVHKYEDVHTRAPRVVRMATGTSLVSSLSCDLYVTAASSDGVKLWDLRTQRCVRKFNHHSCMSKCDVTVSPCGQYIATATDEKSFYVYDIRENFAAHVLRTDEKINALSFTVDSKELITAAETARIFTWSLV